MIPISTAEEFKNAWNSMENPTDVSLFFHGSPTTLNIDWKENQYLTTNENGLTPKENPALFIGDLDPKEIGCLKIYSCQGGNTEVEDNVANTFDKNNKIDKIYATDGSLSFFPHIYTPRLSKEGRDEYIKNYGKKPKGFIRVK